MDPRQVQQQLLQRKYSQASVSSLSSSTDVPSPSPTSDPSSSFHPHPHPHNVPLRQSPVVTQPPRHVDARETAGRPQFYGNDQEYAEHLRRQSIHAAIAAVPTIFNQPTRQPPPLSSASSHIYATSLQDHHHALQNAPSGMQTHMRGQLSHLESQMPGQGPHSPHMSESTGHSPGVLGPADGILEGGIVKGDLKHVITTGVSGATGITPLRDGEGKFPCPSCNKTYLHAKHLKRHLLRHTGDRPYQCVICKDTFSRSDILKRHFQKCTLRNGNPTGASHLAYSDQHKSRKAAAAANAVLAAKGGLPSRRASRDVLTVQVAACTSCIASGLPCSKGNPCDQCTAAGKPCKFNYIRRSASDLRGSLPPVEFGSFGDAHSNEVYMGKQYGHDYGYSHSPASTGGSLQGSSNMSGSSLVQHVEPNPMQQQHPDELSAKHYDWDMFFGETTDPKQEREPFDLPENFAVDLAYSYWPAFPSDALEIKCDRIVDVLRGIAAQSLDVDSPGSSISIAPIDLDEIGFFFSVENVRKYFRGFSLHFLAHFPLIHLPTFNIADATDALFMAIVCMGAVYDSNEVEKVRKLMDVCLSYMSTRENELLDSQVESRAEGYLTDICPTMIEETLASILFHILMTWHGSMRQRNNARTTFSRVVELAKKANLFKPLGPQSPGYSPLHQLTPVDETEWDWKAWIGQELRNRLMFAIYLLDTAFVIYFSTKPIMSTAPVVNIPLPADDVAFEAKTSEECARILGVSDSGSGQQPFPRARKRQLGFQEALQRLMEPSLQLMPGTTNAYGKFILIHALHVTIWTQQDYHYRMGTFSGNNGRPNLARIATEWKTHVSHAPISNLPGVRRNSVSAPSGPNQQGYMEFAQRTNRALDKWKLTWDADLKTEFPNPSTRVGFCRDGLPFYWLGKVFMKHGANPEWRRGKDDDDTLAKVQKLLKKVNDIISKETPGFDTHGAVAAIADNYAINELTFDMKLLFTPVSGQDDSETKDESPN